MWFHNTEVSTQPSTAFSIPYLEKRIDSRDWLCCDASLVKDAAFNRRQELVLMLEKTEITGGSHYLLGHIPMVCISTVVRYAFHLVVVLPCFLLLCAYAKWGVCVCVRF